MKKTGLYTALLALFAVSCVTGGMSVYTFPNGDKYTGQMLRGKRNGKGTATV